jgi:hypothetical protein
MTFEEMLDHALAMLQRRGRVTYRALKLQFRLDDNHLLEESVRTLVETQGLVGDQGAYRLARALPSIQFKHALTQQVAYETLLQERRRALHARIVEALEVLAGEGVAEHVERLAHHAFGGDLWEKAMTYLRQAGVKAFTRSAYRKALTYFEQALTALTHLPETRETRDQAIDVRFDLRNALFPLAQFGRIEGYLLEAERLARTLDDQR